MRGEGGGGGSLSYVKGPCCKGVYCKRGRCKGHLGIAIFLHLRLGWWTPLVCDVWRLPSNVNGCETSCTSVCLADIRVASVSLHRLRIQSQLQLAEMPG